MGNKKKHSPFPVPHSTLFFALLGGLLLYLSVPPVDWGFLGWIAPVPWLWLARRETLPGRRPYVALWLGGLLFWLGAIHWLRLPHPATSLGWLALSIYLAMYAPFFVAVLRVATFRYRWPIVLAAPLLWIGLEKAEAHIWTGFGMGSLGHTQYQWLPVIQVADLFGGYTVSGVVMAVAASIAAALPCDEKSWRPRSLISGAAILAVTLAYGNWRLAEYNPTPGPTITLIQGSIDITLKADPGSSQRIFDHYYDLSLRAKQAHPHTDLIVWPETMYRESLITVDDNSKVELPEDVTLDRLRDYARYSDAAVVGLARSLDTPLLLGIDAIDYGVNDISRYNSAVLVMPDGRIGPRYDKMHPVIFGEYVPLAKHIPWLYKMTPLTGGIESGVEPKAMTIAMRNGGTARVAPDICYESVLGRLIRGQVARLRELGEEPDVLVNLTNDGWFWGSSELDMHLICGVFRAIECRKPMVIAANTGFSAWIDSVGRIHAQGPRQAADWIVADVALDGRSTLYVWVGDWPALGCLVLCLALAVLGWRGRRRSP